MTKNEQKRSNALKPAETYTHTHTHTGSFCLAFILSILTLPTFSDTLTNNSQCDNNTLHTTTGPATLNAIWNANQYQCYPGQYLSASDADYHQCPANSFCDGNGTYTYTDGVDGCLNLCSANSRNKSDYQYSDAGTTTEDACYKTGTTSCSTHTPYFAAHGTATYTNQTASGRMYLGHNPSDALNNADESTDVKLNNVSDCNITNVQCDAGYTKTGSFGPLYPYVQENVLFHEIRSKNLIGNDGWNFGDQTGLSNGDWVATYNDGTQINGVATCVNTDNNSDVVNTYFNQNSMYVVNGTMSMDDFVAGLVNAGAIQSQVQELLSYAQPYMAGYINDDQFGVFKDKAFRTVPGNTFTPVMTGQYCWCKLTGYKLSGGSQQTVSNSRWRYIYLAGNDRCEYDCATNCAREFAFDHMDVPRFNMFGDLASFPTCEPNTINLNWNPDNGNASTQSQCIYDGGITLPDEPSKSGYTFGGWSVHQGN